MFESEHTEISKILELLKLVTDPEMGINIVDLGLINNIKTDTVNKKIKIEMVFTTPNCPMQEIISAEMETAIKEVYRDYDIKIIPIWYPLWTTDRISPQGKILLKLL